MLELIHKSVLAASVVNTLFYSVPCLATAGF